MANVIETYISVGVNLRLNSSRRNSSNRLDFALRFFTIQTTESIASLPHFRNTIHNALNTYVHVGDFYFDIKIYKEIFG